VKKFLFLLFILILLSTAYAEEQVKGLNVFSKRIRTTSANINALLYIKVYEPKDNQKYPAIVMCPGSWEYSEAWFLYFPPFTPEFIANQGFVVVTWDPRGSFMANPGGLDQLQFVTTDIDKYGIGKTIPPFPPSILMLNETLINDLYDVITYTNSLDSVLKNKTTIIGFSHGATYPVIEKAVKKDKRVASLVLIEPIGDESSAVDMLVGNIPYIGDPLVYASKSIPEKTYNRFLWDPLKKFPPHIMGLATKYAADIKIPVIVIQSEQFHASVSAPIFGGECTSPGVTLYESLINTPYKRLNRNTPNADINDLYDFFPSPIWEDGELFCDFFINDIKPIISQ
jgi:pimeloyl-ACP methyl ester carboxylesterase